MTSSAIATKPSIYLYEGGENQKGVSIESCDALAHYFKDQAAIKRCNHKQMKSYKWAKEGILIFPGGICSDWERNIQIKKQKKILRWFKNGGRILGFCAGGYFCASKSEFKVDNKTTLFHERKIALFPGVCKGPAVSKDLKVVRMKWVKSKIEGYVAVIGGGTFIPDQSLLSQSSYEVLATYEEDYKESSVAIVKCKKGQGVAILSSPHLEFNSSHLKVLKLVLADQAKDIELMQQQLDESQPFREECLQNIFKELLKQTHL